MDYTDEQIEEARAIVRAADDKARAEAEAKRLAYIEPVTSLVTDPAFKTVYDALCTMRSTYENDGRFSIQIGALADIMPRLAQEVGVTMQPPVVEASVEDEDAA